MKTPVLLKFLEMSATKANSNYKKIASKKGDAGFTILELLVVVIMLGVLASIAAPGWLGFINRQRVRTVNDRVLQTLRTAQSEAKRTKRDVTITFNPTPATDPPTFTINGNTQQLNAQGEIKKGQITLSTKIAPANPANPAPANPPTPNSITFDYQGNLAPGTTPFVVTVAAVGGTKQCVIVETLLGGMRTAEGNDCPTLP